MLAINDLSFEFGGRYLYEDASWHIKEGDKTALVGLNGTGKSTLLRIISGEYQPESGNISKPGGFKLAFLNQDLLSFQSQESIIEVAMQAFSQQLELKKEIEDLLVLVETQHDDKTIQRLTDAQHEFGMLGGYEMEAQTAEVLEGLGFTTADLQKPLQQFSGGWRMRVILAKMLLQQPDLLLLDEPTNHLDLPSIQWLEQYLQNYTGAFVIVSHDRFFLDNAVKQVVEIRNRQFHFYSGNYSKFLLEREERVALHMAKYENQQDYLRQQERFIERFKAKASKATAVQSRIKQLDKIEKIEPVEENNARLNLRFKQKRTPGKVLLEIRDLYKSYGDLSIFRAAEAKIERGDKIALIGANGKGKSTLLRLIAEHEKADAGIIEPGYQLDIAFYAQHQLESLNINLSILEELQRFAPTWTDNELRTILGCFLFTNDDVFKKIKVLSGGEKSRVAMSKLVTSEANFLLLDEPTNHLDMQSIEILTEALQQYVGSFVLVSHDRFFVQNVANKIWWIENGKLKEYPGTYEEFERWNKDRVIPKEEAAPVKKADKPAPVDQQEPNREQQKQLRNLQTQLQKIEQDEKAITEKIQQLETEMTLPENLNNQEWLQSARKNYDQLLSEKNDHKSRMDDLVLKMLELESQ